MSFELALLIWLGSLFWAAGIFDNLPHRVLTFTRWARPVRTTKVSGRTGKSSPRLNLMRLRGKADHATPRVVGRPSDNPNRLSWEWPTWKPSN